MPGTHMYITMFAVQITIVFILTLSILRAQDCVTPGRQCNDDKACCGGCCQNGICISCNDRTFYIHDYMTSYEDCIEVKHLCMERRCPPGMECFTYQPIPECVGCERRASCRSIRT